MDLEKEFSIELKLIENGTSLFYLEQNEIVFNIAEDVFYISSQKELIFNADIINTSSDYVQINLSKILEPNESNYDIDLFFYLKLARSEDLDWISIQKYFIDQNFESDHLFKSNINKMESLCFPPKSMILYILLEDYFGIIT